MEQMNGRFQLIKNEKFCEFMVAQGIKYEKARELDQFRPIFDIRINRDKREIIIKTIIRESNAISSIFKIGEEVQEKLAVGIMLKSFTTVTNNVITIKSIAEEGDEEGVRNFEFSETGMTLTLSSNRPNVPVAKRYFQRT